MTSFFISLSVIISEKYKIIQELGVQKRRKFGHVYLVEDKMSQYQCVLKTMTVSATNDHLLNHLLHESEFSFDLNGLPNVIYFEKNKLEGFLLLDYKEGITIDEFWKKVPKKERIATIQKILHSLLPIFEHLRLQQIVHCDIKPSNLLIEEKENQLQVSLIDFGLALKTNQVDLSRKILFPLGYAAPEQVLNRLGVINHTSDLFSLGILIWKLFAGKLPLTHPNPSVFTNLQITYPLPDDDSIPKDLMQILRKMCHKHAFNTSPNKMNAPDVDNALENACEQRYKSLPEVLADLDKLRDKRSWLSRVLS